MSKILAKERISQILPTVKCSDCGEDVQIRKLGEHVCSNMPAVPELPILPRQQDKYNKSPSPLHSPNGRYDDKYARGPVTPPYHGLPPDLRRPSVKDYQDGNGRSPPYRDDSRRDDYGYHHGSPKTPTHGQFSAYDRPRNNSTSPAPADLTKKAGSPRQQQHSPRSNGSPRDYFDHGKGYEKSTGGGGGGGALDTLMADLMNSFGSDIHDSTRRPDDLPPHNNCARCGDEFDYRDDVVNDRNKYYHKQCYTCQLCRAAFDHRHPCFEHNGKLYCERDYNVVKKRITCAGW
ncbi:hypothetical protein BJV82DRAFT_668872 [Fennellomyces sp. T-0311]|nr:hypothetical protein BJV82DRAFT_668872 [Fennellomyces sp. T-0311]